MTFPNSLLTFFTVFWGDLWKNIVPPTQSSYIQKPHTIRVKSQLMSDDTSQQFLKIGREYLTQDNLWASTSQENIKMVLSKVELF